LTVCLSVFFGAKLFRVVSYRYVVLYIVAFVQYLVVFSVFNVTAALIVKTTYSFGQ